MQLATGCSHGKVQLKINIHNKVFDRWSSNKNKYRKIPLFLFRIFGSGLIGLGLHLLKCLSSKGESEYLTDGNSTILWN